MSRVLARARRALLPLALAVAPCGAVAGGQGRQDSAHTTTQLQALELDVRAHEAELGREKVTRDRLLRRARELRARRGWVAQISAAWEGRRLRARLEEAVEDLTRRQARLLTLRERRDLMIAQVEEREWQRLQELLAKAAPGSADTLEEPRLTAEVERALEPSTGEGYEELARYRSLVDRLARVNSAIARGGGGRGYTSELLGVSERSAALGRESARAAAPEVWLRLRDDVAAQILQVAGEITRRARSRQSSQPDS